MEPRDHILEKRMMLSDVPAMVGGALRRIIGNQRHLVRPVGLDQLEEALIGITLDIIFAGRKVLPDQLAQHRHIRMADMALIRARMNGEPRRTRLQGNAPQPLKARPGQVPPIAQIGNGIDVNGQLAAHGAGM